MFAFRKIAVLSGLGAMLLATGCASVTNFQSAKPLGQGVAEATGAASFLTVKDPIFDTDSSYTYRTFELQARVGLTEKLDIGAKYTFPSAAALDVKYCLLGAGKERGFYIATGLQAGYTAFGGDDSTSSSKRIEYFIPGYFSLYPVKFLGISFIPSYTGRLYTFTKNYENCLGGNVNLRIGSRFGVVLDYAFFRNFTLEQNETQFGIGAFVPFNRLFN